VTKQARAGLRKVVSFVKTVDESRPDLILRKACVLSDIGEWGQACVIVDGLCRRDRLVSKEKSEFVDGALACWFARQMVHWRQIVDPNASARALDVVVAHLKVLSALRGAEWPAYGIFTTEVLAELASTAAGHRAAERFEAGEKTAEFLMNLANQLVRDFPQDARSHILLSEAFLQQSKNAWRRNDHPGIRQALTRSVESLERGLVRDPDNREIRRLLRDREARLAKLAESGVAPVPRAGL
jgi:hypothetical protein